MASWISRRWRANKERWKALLAEYGRIAVIVYLALFALSIAGFAIAISSGLDLGDWTGGRAGTIGAAWVATKITQPIRIAATVGLTPIVARVFRRPPTPRGELTDESE